MKHFSGSLIIEYYLCIERKIVNENLVIRWYFWYLFVGGVVNCISNQFHLSVMYLSFEVPKQFKKQKKKIITVVAGDNWKEHHTWNQYTSSNKQRLSIILIVLHQNFRKYINKPVKTVHLIYKYRNRKRNGERKGTLDSCFMLNWKCCFVSTLSILQVK